MIDAFATQVSAIRHIAPVLAAIPEEMRGAFYLEMNGNELGDLIQSYPGLQWRRGRPPFTTDPVLIAAAYDLAPGTQCRPVVFIEHGSGQTYRDSPMDHCYSGGGGREGVRLFLNPSERVAARNRARYLDAVSVAVGDPTIVQPTDRVLSPIATAFSFHFDLPLGIPETRTSWHYWAPSVLALAKERPIIGHGHPRLQHEIMPWWETNGIPAVPRWEDVVRMASVLICDNSSVLYEFAALDRPVVVLDAPWYRRDVEVGYPRFWSCADVGVRIGDPADLADAVALALTDPPEIAKRRREIVAEVYLATGEEALMRSVAAIAETFPHLWIA